jgi:hypothetical protein
MYIAVALTKVATLLAEEVELPTSYKVRNYSANAYAE